MSRRMRCCSLVLLSVFIAPWATEAKVVSSFDECSQFFCKGVEPLLFQAIVPLFNASHPVRICQRYGKETHFATVYNTALRIPVYSAYKKSTITTVGGGNRPPQFFIEPQLDLPGGSEEMSPEPRDGVGKNQALNSDYTHTGYDRGHLYPFSFNPGRGTATCTLTNAVPMRKSMNIKWYHSAERLVRAVTRKCPPKTTLFAITGAIPSGQYLNDRVNIPHRVYTYYSCCPEGRHNESDKETDEEAEISGGYTLSLDVKTGELLMETVTLKKLQQWLGSSIEVNPEWAKRAVSRREGHLLEVISEILKPSLELSGLLTAPFDALSFIALGIYASVAWVCGMFISGLVRVVWGVFSTVATLVDLVVAAVTWILSAVLGLIGAIANVIGVLVSKGFLSVANTLLSVITSEVKFLLTSIASIPTHIIDILTKLLTLVFGVIFDFLQLCGLLLSFCLGFLNNFVGLAGGAICLIAICAKYLPNAPPETIDYLKRLVEKTVKLQPPARDKSEWVSRVWQKLRDLLRKSWTAIANIPPAWKMLLGIASILGIFEALCTVVLGFEALVCLGLTILGLFLCTNFSKTSVLFPLQVLLVATVRSILYSFAGQLCQLKKRSIKYLRSTCIMASSPKCKLNTDGSHAKSDILKVYFSNAKELCVENDIPTLVILLGSFIGNIITSPFMHVGIRAMVGMVVAALMSVVTDGTKPRYSRASLIAAFASSAILIYNAITYLIIGIYCVMCAIFTNIGTIIFIVMVTGIGIMIAIGDNLEGFSERGRQFLARINANLRTPLSTAILSTATRVREASRNRSPVMVCLVVIIVILIILTTDPLFGIVTEFLKAAFLTGFLIVLALVTRESINPRRD